jgi:hypothetical protein
MIYTDPVLIQIEQATVQRKDQLVSVARVATEVFGMEVPMDQIQAYQDAVDQAACLFIEDRVMVLLGDYHAR